MLAPWAGAYVGIPWQAHGRTRAGCDCYGLTCLVYEDVYRIRLPSYAGSCDLDTRAGWPSIQEAVTRGLVDWEEIPPAEANIGDGLVLRLAGHPLHVGLVVGVSPLAMLHIRPSFEAVIERLDSPLWARRLDKVYRWRR